MATAPVSDQRALLEVAKIDKSIARLEHDNLKHPLRQKLGATMNLLAAQGRTLDSAEAIVEDCKDSLLAAEKRSADIQKNIENKEAQLSSGAGLTSRDLLALQEEIGGLRGLLEEASEKEFSALEALEVAESKVAGVHREIASLKEALLQGKAELEDQVSAIIAEQESLRAQREAVVTSLDKDLVRIYERARARGGYSVISMKSNGVTDAGISISPVEVAEIKALPEDDIYLSEDYDCIVVRDWL